MARKATTQTRARDTVTIPRVKYEALMKELEDLRDAHDLRVTKAAAHPEDALPGPLVKRLISGDHPVRIWREHRGLTLRALAGRSGVPDSYISEIEMRKKPGSVRALKALAAALEVGVDDLVP